MKTTISDLPRDLIEEILARVPLKRMRAVRFTCKKWNTLSKSESFRKMHIGIGKAAAREGESTMIAMMNCSLYLTSVTAKNNNNNVDDPSISIEFKGELSCLSEQVEISQVYHCEGLLLCILKDDTRYVVWNPYLGETKWIEPRFSHRHDRWDRFLYAIGYEVKKSGRRCVKLLRFIHYWHFPHEKHFTWYEIYNFDSGLWTTLDVTPNWFIPYTHDGISLKGNTYWSAHAIMRRLKKSPLICFDFTRERFGPFMPLPFKIRDHQYFKLSCVREEKLSVLSQRCDELYPYEVQMWISTNVDVDKVSWSKIFKLDLEDRCPKDVPFISSYYLIDEEKKLAMSFYDGIKFMIIGEAECFKVLDLVVPDTKYCYPQLCSYVPSLVRIKRTAIGKRKKQSSSEKRRFAQNMLRRFAYVI